ncbi:MAG: hypothetical protein C4554_08045 [Dethiobacter sp.]|nr:MAG: hypothetical protein C4554_08045 [Dethiobacter sp.]
MIWPLPALTPGEKEMLPEPLALDRVQKVKWSVSGDGSSNPLEQEIRSLLTGAPQSTDRIAASF